MKSPLERTRYDWFIEVLSLLAVVAACCPLLFYGQLGEGNIIPIHYNVAGEIDGWGTRSFLWQLPLVAFVFYAGLTLCERYYKKFNLPFKVTDGNATPIYRLSVRLIRLLKLVTILIFAYLNISSLAIALNKGNGLNIYIMTALILTLFAVIVIYYMKMLSYKE